MYLVGHPEVIEEDWFSSGADRAKHADLLDEYVGGWIAQHDLDDVIKKFEEAEAAVAPIYDISQIMDDPQFKALESIVSIDDPDLGSVKMQNVMFRMSETPGRVQWAGRGLGEDNQSVYVDELGLSNEQMATLIEEGVL
jgi:crotonobetainyl-CoA:carnitine CoA-transferase CaiB-like acyl-CoA transferase